MKSIIKVILLIYFLLIMVPSFATQQIPSVEILPYYPGNFPTFWFSFLISFIFGYTLYLAGIGFLTVIWIYIATHDKIETHKAIWGFITGVLLGIGLRLLILYFST